MMKKYFIQFLFAYFGLWSSLCFAATDPLVEIINEGVSQSFGIQSQKLKLDQSQNMLKNSYAALLPSLSMSAGKDVTTSESTTNGLVEPTTTTSYSASVNASWTIWDHYKNIRDTQIYDNAFRGEKINSKRQVSQYILNLVNAYLEYQLRLSQKEILNNLLKESLRTQEESNALVKAGARTQLDSMDTEIQVVNTGRDLLELYSSIAAAERNLSVLLNSNKYKEFPQIDLLKFEPYYMADFKNKLEAIKKRWKSEFLGNNPDIVISRLDLEKTLLQLKFI